MLLLLLGLPLARRLGLVANLRGYAIFAAPVFTAFNNILSLFRLLIFPLAFVVVWQGGKQGFPAAGSADRVLAEQIFGVGYLVFVGAVMPIALGMPLIATARQLQGGIRTILEIARWTGGISVGMVVFQHPGAYWWHSSAVAASGLAYIGILGWMTATGVAWTNFYQTPPVQEEAGREIGWWYFLHTSDVHATLPVGSEPAGGGHTGTRHLAEVAAHLTAGDGRPAPRFLIDTGDIVDRGLDTEWNEPLQSLRKIRDIGIRVVITPGNHDLVPTYDFNASFWAARGKQFANPDMDGARLFKYLSVASELEPQLLTCTGASLRELVDREKNRLTRLLALWDDARDDALRTLNISNPDHRWVLTRMQLQHPGVAEQIASDFAARAHDLYPEWDQAEWRRLLFQSAPQHMQWSTAYRIWSQRWTDLFPLRVEIAGDNVEFLILNSIAQEARLAGSARGQCGDAQLGRLRERLAGSPARVAIILHHHAPFRFPLEQGESGLQRWAMLAHDSVESGTLRRLLVEASTPQKQVMLLAGHIHRHSRCGKLAFGEVAEENTRPPVWILESGALGEPITTALPSGWMTETGVIEPRLMPRPHSAEENTVVSAT